MSDIASRISALSPDRQRLLEQLRGKAAEGGRAQPRPAVPPREAARPRTGPFELISEEDRGKLPDGLEDAYPLSMVQLGMLYHMEMTPDATTPAYHNVNSFHLEAPFDAEVFQRAVDHAVADHEYFRVSFDLTTCSEPLQLVHRDARLQVQVEDLRHLPEAERQRIIDELVLAENRRLIDLSRPPLVRFYVHRRTDDSFQLTLTEPHSISDGWSTMSSLTDLFLVYRAMLDGEQPPPSPPLAVSFRDFVRMERDALASEDFRRFWAGKLEGYELVPLPRWPAYLRTSRPTDRKPALEVPGPVVSGLFRLMRRAGVPFKSILLAAHLKVMAVLSGNEEVTTGLTTNGRPEDPDGDRVRGLFLNTLPLRFHVAPGTWAELARAAVAAELELMPYRRYPLAALQRMHGGGTLFESAFSYLHFHTVARLTNVGGMSMKRWGNSDLSVTHFPLAVTFHRTPLAETGLELTLELNADTLSDDQGRAIQGYFLRALEAMAEAPDARHELTGFLSDKEQHQVLVQWNPPAREVPAGPPLHRLFERQAAQRPGAVAVSGPEEALTYGELDRRASRLAGHLRALGVGPEILVGICLQRSPEMLVALLATLKAGGAYVPLDPAYPAARLEFLLRDSGARVLLTRRELLPDLPEHGALVVCLGDEEAAGAACPTLPDVAPENAAYVIYTSGSTGQPKGVVVTHANVSRLLAATHDWFGFGPPDVWTLFHSFAFDFSVWEIWGALAFGGRLVVVPYLVSRSPEAFYRLLVDEGVTVLSQTPSAFHQLQAVEESQGGAAGLALRTVVFGGEALDPLALRPWIERHGDERPRLINMYGITETTVHVTYRPVSAADLVRGAGSWIGGPIPDLRVYVLDASFQPAPPAVSGELSVGGAGLARGYLRRPELTAERFVPDPYGDPGSRLYRSGDLARFLPDGELEYLGRIDHQVKIRGFRIELGEIEAALLEHPAVRQAAVLARQDGPGEARLAAYVVPREGAAEPTVSELRDFLRARLPEHFVPAAYVTLAELPLTAHGKLDRRALPAPDAARPDLGAELVTPRTPLEQALAEAWAEALAIERVGVHDNFFALGGDSIRSIRVVARARERGLELSVPLLFQHPTVAELAAALAGPAAAEAAMVSTHPFELVSPADRERFPEDLEDAYPLTRLQAGMLFHMDLMAEAPLYHNVESFHLRARFELEPFEAAVQRVVARHPILRTSFHLSTYSEPLQLVHRAAVLPITIEDLRGLGPEEQGRRVHAFVEQERRRSFDLTKAPQWRFHVHLRDEETFQFTFTENHAIFDGWSLYSTLTEIFLGYQSLLHGQPLPEVAPPLPFREFVAAERAALRSPEAVAFWRAQLGDTTFLRVPRWRPTSVAPGERNVHAIEAPIARSTSAALQEMALGARIPLKSVLMAAHLTVLSRLSGIKDVMTGMVMNGRLEVEGGEETRGLFLNSLPFRLQLAGGSWLDLARAAFATEQAMLPFRRYPLSDLQNETGGEPLFETVFNFTHFHVTEGISRTGQVAVLDFFKSTETNFTLTLGFTLDPPTQQVMLEVAGNARELPAEQVEAIAGWYARALWSIAADPGTPFREAPLLAPSEVHQILHEWNDTAREMPVRVPLLHELFEASVRRTPDAVAVIDDQGEATYAEVERMANRLARHLRDLGVGPGTLVGVYLERSLAMIPALLAILKAGGAYVPLSRDWPESRIEWILGKLGVRHLVTQAERLEQVGAFAAALVAPAHVVCVGPAGGVHETGGAGVSGRESWEPLAAAPLPRVTDADDLAYIIFTSGSTGHPKGVAVRHRPVVNLISWSQESFGIGPSDRVLFVTALTFDLSVYDVFGLLAAGGSVRVASAADLAEPERLLRLMRDEPITFWDSAPAALQQLVPLFSAVLGLAASRLRLVFLSGDWIPLPLPDLVREAFPGARVISLGGATEATVWSNWFPIGAVDPRWISIPYGRPITNARYYVLDTALQPAPVGTPGDLYIGGGCLSSGYANEPVLTARGYVPDPFAELPGSRLYRTGDRARYGTDGLLEFLGRLDNQVKIRGYRIELGEIESVLAEHEGVRDPVVLAREDVPGQRRLVAYFVPRREPAPEPAELRGFLATALPDYMLPALFIPLAALPVTANGKLDRAALPVPEIDRSGEERRLVAPRTPLERNLAAAWQEVLGGEVGVQDNFFEMGGHSLLAIQLVTRLRETLGVELPLRALFDSPTIARLAEQIAALQGHGPALPVPSALPRVVAEPERLGEPFPLTDLQQAYWLGQRADFDLGGVSAHIYEELEVPDLDVERFESAWRRLIERHPMLRMVVLPDGRQQVLASVPPFQVEILDLRGLEAERAEAGAVALRARMAERGPDTGSWPLFEVALSLFDGGARIHVSLSLLVSDALSGQVLTRELIRFYADPLAELPPLAVTYRDLVVATRAFEESQAFQESLAYWRERLPGLPPAPLLPVAAESVRRATFARRTWALESEGWTRLQARAARAGVTPTVAVLTVYSEVLAAWSKSPRFTLNILYFNRPPLHPQIEEIVGNFSSTLLLEVDAGARAGFEARAQRLQERLWQDLEHGRVSGVRILRELQRLHGANARPTMPVVFTSDLGLVRAESEAPADGMVAHSSGALQTPQVWLDHQVSERSGRLVLNWDVVEEVFPPRVVDDMFGAYCRLVAGLAEDDGLWREAPPLLTPAEQLALFAEANATAEPYQEALLHAPFEAQARARPEAPAVFASDRTLTYGELVRLSRRVGRRLRDLGARPDTLVAVVMEKGWEQIVAVLGILQSGAAYLPIDPSVPGERLRYLLASGEVVVALTQPRFLDALDWPVEVRRLVVDPEEGGEDAPLEALQRPEHLAYVIFTSGSTGQPKGVAIEHRAALNTVLDVNRRFGIGADDRVLALSALNFDLSVWDVFGLLAAGGAIVLPEAEELREPARWAERMSAHRVTVWNSVPALLEMLVDHLEDGGDPAPADLRLSLLSGDWIPSRLPDRLRALVPSVELVSLGGATEASIWSILHPIGEVDPRWTSIPYGRPMANQRFHVLGERLEPRPLWVPGELYIGGIGVAREYWHDAERTRASFIQHPETGERLYRTGDLGRWRPEGTIEFLGREDLQVKVQGYRIELGEIEAALSQHPEVRACVVAALGGQRASKRLVAYVVASSPEPGGEELRQFLAGKLPAYMVPSAFVALETLPLTPNGKVDRGALPEPERLARQDARRMPPRDELEARLASIWEDLLGIAPVGVHDDFFDLGGHSLVAVRLMARIRAGWEQDLPISTLFQAGTIESLAAVLRLAGTGAPARSPLVEIRRGEGTPLFLVHPVGGSVLCYRELARALGGTEPVWGIEAEEATEAHSLEGMAAAYLRTVREVWPHGPWRLGGWSMGGTLAFEMARQLRQAGSEVDRVLLIDPSAPGAAGPVVVDDATLASWFAHDLAGLAGIDLAGTDLKVRPEELRGLEPAAEAERLLELAREARALPPGLEAEEVRRRLDVFRRNYQALLAYSPSDLSVAGDVPLALFVAADGTSDVAPWQTLALGKLEIDRIPGDHYSIVRPPAVQALAARLRACLDTVAVTLEVGR
jgi:amino acid adenylation domain-containing protein